MLSLTAFTIKNLLYALIFITTGYFVAKLCARSIKQLATKRFTEHQQLLFYKGVFYFVFILFLFAALDQLGFDLAVLLGAAGVFSVAISFAAKTSASNLISGIFLLVEHPFKVGDTIQYKNFTGKVETINLLSTFIKTTDNRQIRIPNEGLVKADIVNFSANAKRRTDILVGVGYNTDIFAAKQRLLALAENHANIQLTPKPPAVIVNELLESAVELKLTVWAKSADLIPLKADLLETIVKDFATAGIDIPYPQLTVHKPSA